ncbi:MAG: hypothetical protein AAFY88_31510, partial [Acidobacteriota bacterium]
MESEEDILLDLHTRTGHRFTGLGGIQIQSEDDASGMYPVILEWIDKLEKPVFRQILYLTFTTPYADGYSEALITRL